MSVVVVARPAGHGLSKELVPSIRLLSGLGVEGDAHMGVTIKHRSRVAVDPKAPNLRQVHLIHAELFEELRGLGFEVSAGDLGENIVTRGVNLLGLPAGARLHLGAEAVVEITGLRNPCAQLDGFRAGLTRAVLGRGPEGEIVRKCGVMGVVVASGTVAPGYAVLVEAPVGKHRPLERV